MQVGRSSLSEDLDELKLKHPQLWTLQVWENTHTQSQTPSICPRTNVGLTLQWQSLSHCRLLMRAGPHNIREAPLRGGGEKIR